MKKRYWRLVLRVVLTVAAWVLLVVYFHKLGHQYLGGGRGDFEPAHEGI